MRDKIVDKPVGVISYDVPYEETLKSIEHMVHRRPWILLGNE